jgi:hypothetical protein
MVRTSNLGEKQPVAAVSEVPVRACPYRNQARLSFESFRRRIADRFESAAVTELSLSFFTPYLGSVDSLSSRSNLTYAKSSPNSLGMQPRSAGVFVYRSSAPYCIGHIRR